MRGIFALIASAILRQTRTRGAPFTSENVERTSDELRWQFALSRRRLPTERRAPIHRESFNVRVLPAIPLSFNCRLIHPVFNHVRASGIEEEPDAVSEDSLASKHGRTAADEAWLRFYATRRDVKKSLLQDLFSLTQHGPPSLFSSPNAFFNFIDALPGVPFRQAQLQLDGTAPVPFGWRSLLDVIAQLIDRHNGGFLDPIEAEMTEPPTDFIHGERFRRLHARLCEKAGPDAVLMPIILNSGLCNRLFPIRCKLPCAMRMLRFIVFICSLK